MSARTAIAVLLLLGCGAFDPRAPLPSLRGTVAAPADAKGDAYLFLYAPGEGPPRKPALPVSATAVPSARLHADPHFVFANVGQKPYRLWGFVDQDQDVRFDVDVLAQPSAGDLTFGGLDVADLSLPDAVPLDQPVAHDPPSFEIPGVEPLVVLPDLPLVPVRFTVRIANPAGLVDQAAFEARLVDRDGDGVADDDDADGTADLYPRLAFRFLNKPGQTMPDAGQGATPEVLLPAVIESQAQLQATLAGDPSSVVVLDELPLLVLPVALGPSGPLPAIPVGEYQLVGQAASGQVWTLPNPLGAQEPSQAVRFFVQHALFASGLP